jgi:UDP-N-acetyl-2-amino-2-deoxyglucuronate dehydrogenase
MNYKGNDKINFAVVGCGHIGKKHAEMVAKNHEAELVALCDIKSKFELNLEYQSLPFFNSIDDLLKSGLDLDVINICTPNGYHAAHTIKCLEEGKHVVCEKPMSLQRTGAEEMISAAQKNSKIIFTVMQNRYSPPSLWIKEVIQNKLLGEIFMVQVNCYWNRDERYYKSGDWKGTITLDGGPLFTQFSHFIDIMVWLFGDIKDIRSGFQNFNHPTSTEFEDSGQIDFSFLNGTKGSIHYSTSIWKSNFESSLTVIGSKGTIRIGGQYMNDVVYCEVDNYIMPVLEPVNEGNNYGAYKGSASNHQYVIQNVVDTMKGKAKPFSTAEEGLMVVDIIERIYKQRDLKDLTRSLQMER